MTTAADGNLRIRDPKSGALLLIDIATSRGGYFSDDDKYVRNLDRWVPLERTEHCRVLHHGEVGNRAQVGFGAYSLHHVSFSSDSLYLASSGKDGARVWQIPSAKEVTHLPGSAFATFLLDGDLVDASVNRHRRSNLAPGEMAPAWDVRGEVLQPTSYRARISVSNDGKWLSFVRKNEQCVLNLETNQLITKTIDNCWAMAVNPDGTLVAGSAGGSDKGNSVEIWNPRTGAHITELIEPHPTLLFSPNGKWLVNSSYNSTHVRQTSDWNTVARFSRASYVRSGGPAPVCFTADSRYLLMTPDDFHVCLVNTTNWKAVANFESPQMKLVSAAAISPNGRWIAVASAIGTIYVWDVQLVRETLRDLNLDWQD